MNMLMIDLETLSLEHNAAIASIGLVAFSLEGIIDKQQIDVCLDSCEKAGMHISASTVKWWMMQSDEARGKTFHEVGRVGIKEAVQKTTDFYTRNSCENVYGNGAVADLVWIKNAYKAVDEETPWGFWNELCYRTIRATLPPVDGFVYSGESHVAVDDAENQARYMIEAIKRGVVNGV